MPRWWRYMSDEELARCKRLADEARFATIPPIGYPEGGYSPSGGDRHVLHAPAGPTLFAHGWKGSRCHWPRNQAAQAAVGSE